MIQTFRLRAALKLKGHWAFGGFAESFHPASYNKPTKGWIEESPDFARPLIPKIQGLLP
jgi:hypothetical protein